MSERKQNSIYLFFYVFYFFSFHILCLCNALVYDRPAISYLHIHILAQSPLFFVSISAISRTPWVFPPESGLLFYHYVCSAMCSINLFGLSQTKHMSSVSSFMLVRSVSYFPPIFLTTSRIVAIMFRSRYKSHDFTVRTKKSFFTLTSFYQRAFFSISASSAQLTT